MAAEQGQILGTGPCDPTAIESKPNNLRPYDYAFLFLHAFHFLEN